MNFKTHLTQHAKPHPSYPPTLGSEATATFYNRHDKRVISKGLVLPPQSLKARAGGVGVL